MIYTLGESLLDVIIENPDKVNTRPGGAMLNVAVSLARTKTAVSLITELGDDQTSKFLLDFLAENQVNIDYIKKYYQCNTTLALAFLDELKKPTYTFYKSYPKNRRLLCPARFDRNDILLFGSLYALDRSIRNELISILTAAKQAGVFICYDPNIRHSHHLEDKDTRNALKENIALADMIKGSDEDFENIFGKQPLDAHLNEVRKLNPMAPLIITRGDAGVAAFAGDFKIELPAISIDVVSTIGAGDAFNAGITFAMNQLDLQKKREERFSRKEVELVLKKGLSFSAAVCSSIENYIGIMHGPLP